MWVGLPRNVAAHCACPAPGDRPPPSSLQGSREAVPAWAEGRVESTGSLQPPQALCGHRPGQPARPRNRSKGRTGATAAPKTTSQKAVGTRPRERASWGTCSQAGLRPAAPPYAEARSASPGLGLPQKATSGLHSTPPAWPARPPCPCQDALVPADLEPEAKLGLCSPEVPRVWPPHRVGLTWKNSVGVVRLRCGPPGLGVGRIQ